MGFWGLVKAVVGAGGDTPKVSNSARFSYRFNGEVVVKEFTVGQVVHFDDHVMNRTRSGVVVRLQHPDWPAGWLEVRPVGETGSMAFLSHELEV